MDYVSERLKEIADERPDFDPLACKNVERGKTRHGKVVTYYRKGKGKRVRLPNREDVTEIEFRKAYDGAASGKPIQKPKRSHVRGEFGPPGKPGYVYFVRDGSVAKIGFTTNIRSRIKAIQIACANPLEVLLVMPGTTETEKFFHTMFRDYRVGGEWFSLTGLLAEFAGYEMEASRSMTVMDRKGK